MGCGSSSGRSLSPFDNIIMYVTVLAYFLLALSPFLLYLVYSFLPDLIRHLYTIHRFRKLQLPTIKGEYFLGISFTFANFFLEPRKMCLSTHVLNFTLGISEIYRKYGFFKMDLGFIEPAVFVYKAEFAARLLKDSGELRKSKEYVISQPFLGGGLLSSEPMKWKKDRKTLQPAFHSQKLASFQTVISSKSHIMIRKIELLLNKEMSCLDAMFENFLLDSVCETCLGFQLEEHGTVIHPLANAVNLAADSFVSKTVVPWFWFRFMSCFSPTTIKYNRQVRYINQYAKKIYLNKVKSAEKLERSETENEDKRRLPFLDLMFQQNCLSQSKERFSEKDIIDHIKNLLLAGFDAPGAAMIWTAYFLGWYPEVQRKALAEVDSIFKGDTEREITIEDLKSMVYLEMVIKESLRIVPSGPIIGRTLEKDLEMGGHTIPKGTSVYIHIYSLHRDPVVFPNPEIFCPERFLDNDRHPYSYLPFSGGPRNCIGFSLAMQEIKTAFGDLLRNFEWKSLDARDVCFPELKTLTAHPRQHPRFIMKKRTNITIEDSRN